MIKKIEGIIISSVDYKESSKIINVLTPTEGMIGILAKGCKNIKSKLSATTNLLSYGIFHLNYHNGSIPYLIEIDILNNLKNIKKDLIRLNYSLFLAELASQVSKTENTDEIYQLLIDGLLKINDFYDSQIITNIIELKLLKYLGIKPSMNECVNCKSKSNIVTISSYKGGLLCQNCLGNEAIFQLKTIKLIRLFFEIDLKKITKIEINDDIKKELNLFIDDYYDRYSGLYLKSKNLLQKFSQFNQVNQK